MTRPAPETLCTEATDAVDVDTSDLDIAVIGMAGRFPGADTVDQLWERLLAGDDLTSPITSTRFTEVNGHSPGPRSVLREAVITGVDQFDHEYFGISSAEADRMDPQHRLFIQSCHHALEAAGYDPTDPGLVTGVFAASGQGDYLMRNLLPAIEGGPASVDMFSAAVANLVSSMPTRVAYLLGLTGPSLAVQTACSSSLVAVDTACQQLLDMRCDMALAGGTAVNPTPGAGYDHEPGGLLSEDGHCRAFDADATGMAVGDGVGVVLLKRLADAVADGDHIHAVISGSAVNNDGRRKVGFTAPSVTGQADVIADALHTAGVAAGDIGYLEAHGTGTPVGDPIELTALSRAFADATGPCLVGSIKSNLGHTDTAAGVLGLMKTVLCVEHGMIPPSLHIATPNPALRLGESPFRLATERTTWPRPGRRHAGVSSFGIGGTNAHVVVSQAPRTARIAHRRPLAGEPAPGVVVLSAATPAALERQRRQLSRHLDRPEPPALSDIVFVLDRGRRALPHRWACVTTDVRDLPAMLESDRGHTGVAPPRPRPVAFAFSGGGVLDPGAVRDLRSHPVISAALDEATACGAEIGTDFRGVLDGSDPAPSTAASFCATIAVEYALTALLSACGVTPCAVVGSSLGEYAAALTAGVLSLPEALRIVALRGNLLEHAGGRTLVVPMGVDELHPVLGAFPELAVAADNGPAACLVSGPRTAVAALADRLAQDGVETSVLRVPAAVHSPLLEPYLHDFHTELTHLGISGRTPRIDFVAAADGALASVVDAAYYVRQTREPVRVTASLDVIRETHGDPVILEVGPGRALAGAARALGRVGVHTAPSAPGEIPARVALADALARLWVEGVEVEVSRFSADPTPQRVGLPGYPFEPTRHWIDAVPATHPPVDEPLPGSPTLIPEGLGRGWDHSLRHAGTAGAGPLTLTHPHPVTAAVPNSPPLTDLTPADGTADLLDMAGDDVLDAYTAAVIAAHLGRTDPVIPPYDRLITALRDLVQRHLRDDDAGGTAIATRAGVSAARPDLVDQLALIDHCAAHLVPVVSGEETGIEALYGSDAARELNHRVEDRRADALLEQSRAAVVEVLEHLARTAGDRPLRVLEIGAGRGFITWPVAEALRDLGTPVEYTVTDVGPSLVADLESEARRRGLDFVDAAVLDAGAPLTGQGSSLHTHDVVIAFNSLHAVPDLYRACATVSDLLAPGGTAVLLELRTLPGHALLTAGLLPGMWHHRDPVRRVLPVVEPEVWRQLLGAVGMDTTSALPDGSEGHHALILGRSAVDEPSSRLAHLRALGVSVDVLVGSPPWSGDAEVLSLTRVPGTPATVSAPDRVSSTPAAHPTDAAGRDGDGDTPPGAAVAAPMTTTETYVSTVFGEMLGSEILGPAADFFDSGGDSLLAMRALSRIRRDLGVEVPSRALFEHPTVCALAALLEESGARTPSSPSEETSPAPRALRRRGGRSAVVLTDGTLDIKEGSQ